MYQEYVCDDELLKFAINQSEDNVNQSGELLIHRTYTLPNGQDNTLTILVGLDGLYRHSTVNSHDLESEEESNDRETVTVSTIVS